ncbi:DUF5302 domain-containing protein [Streptomyces sp. E5N91]|uniref:DUF5302 domain-containing protein n=1 Tax=Streptomyces sp. E5N91 TaxID=1851996 RepID=UPI000EF5FDD5|nr:DUF5302 domain-containing protein [Streptomyces sp. E5N91]
MTEESSSHAGSEPAEAEGTALTPDADGQYNLKDKFRQALERKRGKQAEAAALAANADVAKIRGTHGPAASQRSFRRKSG